MTIVKDSIEEDFVCWMITPAPGERALDLGAVEAEDEEREEAEINAGRT